MHIDDVFKVMDSEVSVTENSFQNILSTIDVPVNGSPSETIESQVFYTCT